MKRILITTLVLLTLPLTGCGEQDTSSGETTLALHAPAPTPPASTPSYREVNWDELIPADWDPMKNFEGIDLNLLDDGDPRAMAALERLRAEWDNAPANAALNGAAIRIAGYVVPLDGMGETLNEFLLVAYFGACIHTPPPPSNQIIHVTLEHPAPGIQSMDTVWVEGVLQTGHSVTDMGDSSYRMQAARVDVFK